MAKRYQVHICISDADDYLPVRRVERSADKCVHTPMPDGYSSRIDFCEQASKTHAQVRCPHCGLWAVWLPKAEAREINKRDRADERRVVKAYNEFCDAREQAMEQPARATKKKGKVRG